MDNGWIKLHRSFLNWEWYDSQNTSRLFIHCLLKANHKDGKHQGDIVPRGTFLTSLDILSQQTGLSVKSVRTSLKHLEKTGEIGTERARKGTRLTICKYDTYQSLEVTTGTETGTPRANEGQTKGTEGATNNNDKNKKKDKKIKIFVPPTLEEVKAYFKEKGFLESVAERAFTGYDENDWHDTKGNPVKNWKSKMNNVWFDEKNKIVAIKPKQDMTKWTGR
ncbi:MAG: hypothetical protein V3U78_05470 [Thiotrichaceae bacterium]